LRKLVKKSRRAVIQELCIVDDQEQRRNRISPADHFRSAPEKTQQPVRVDVCLLEQRRESAEWNRSRGLRGGDIRRFEASRSQDLRGLRGQAALANPSGSRDDEARLCVVG
jgi:hypothetical protein